MPVRSTRGKRVAELIGEEKEFDDFFWGQEVFKDEEVDDEYVTESEPEDTFDADFFKDESSEEDNSEDVDQDNDEKTSAIKEEKAKIKPPKETDRRRKRRRMAVSMKNFTQQQMLEEAALTELFNLHALKEAGNLSDSKDILLSRKRRGLLPPIEKYVSKGKNVPLYSFSIIPEFPKPTQIAKRSKYLDPLTNKRYSTISEFRQLREGYFKAMETTLNETS